MFKGLIIVCKLLIRIAIRSESFSKILDNKITKLSSDSNSFQITSFSYGSVVKIIIMCNFFGGDFF